MQKHGESYRRMPDETRNKYEAQASLVRASSQDKLGEDIAEARANAEVLSSRVAAKLAERPPLMLSGCSISEQDDETWSAMMWSNDFNRARTAALRQTAQAAPALLPPAFQAKLESRH